MESEFLLGFLSLILIFFLIQICTSKQKNLKSILLAAFFARSLIVILENNNLILLPDSYGDALKFENLARDFSRNEGLYVALNFFKNDSLLISKIISIFYTIFGESKMMAQSISVGLGVLSVHLIYKISLILWDHHSAKKAAWVSAIFPTLILYSSIILREIYIIFFY